jgi:hypothetical protein
MQQGAVLVQEMAQRWSTSSMTRRWTRDRAASAVVILISYHFSRAESVFCWYNVFFSLFKNKIEKQRMSSSELSFYQPDNQPQTHGKNFNYMTDIYVHCIQTDLRKNKQNKWIHEILWLEKIYTYIRWKTIRTGNFIQWSITTNSAPMQNLQQVICQMH